MIDNDELAAQLAVINQSTATLVEIITELRELATVRLEKIEAELNKSTRQLQQSVMLLAQLAGEDVPTVNPAPDSSQE